MSAYMYSFVEKRQRNKRWRWMDERYYDKVTEQIEVRHICGDGTLDYQHILGFEIAGVSRGLPKDISSELLDYHETSEYHMYQSCRHSWITLDELLNYDWLKILDRETEVTGVEYIQWRGIVDRAGSTLNVEPAREDAICATERISNAKMDLVIKQDGDLSRFSTIVHWEETHAHICSRLWVTAIPSMLKLAMGDYHSVRLVCWFDQ